ncbi:MAG: bestrophin family protein [Planctomycetaceae bacterium]
MLVKKRVGWLRVLFTFHGSSLPFTWRRILGITMFSVFVTWLELYYQLDQRYSLTDRPFTLIGLALGIFLGFRNNAAYDRYWEGRKLWGQLVNTSRSFTRQVLTLVGPQDQTPLELRPFQEGLVRQTIAYVYALRHHLRDTDPFADLERFVPAEDVQRLRRHKNIPVALLQEMGLQVRTAWDRGWMTAYHLPALDKSLTTLTDIQGGCERIKNTPIPYAYTVLIHRLVAFYCFFLPFGIVHTVGPLTPIVVLLIAHAFFGLDEIGDEIEDPFDTDPQSLPLNALCRTIEIILLQAIDAIEVPEMLLPVRGILS